MTLLVAAIAQGAYAQSAGQPNEGLSLAQDPNTGIFTMSWWAKAGRTYFIQQTGDLLNWSFLPMMDTASDAAISYQFTSSAAQSFWRLQYTDTTYDEWAESVGYDPEFPPDPTSLAPANPALTILQCYQNGYNPFDYYAGREPSLKILSGNNQLGAPSQPLAQPLVVEARDPLGNLLVNAPIFASITGGDFNGSLNGEWFFTDTDGQISIIFTTPPDAAATSQITVQAGTNNQVVVVFTEGNMPPPDPPTGVDAVQNADGSIDVTWVYPADTTVSFDIQIRGPLGDWLTIGNLPANTSSVHINFDGSIAQ